MTQNVSTQKKPLNIWPFFDKMGTIDFSPKFKYLAQKFSFLYFILPKDVSGYEKLIFIEKKIK